MSHVSADLYLDAFGSRGIIFGNKGTVLLPSSSKITRDADWGFWRECCSVM